MPPGPLGGEGDLFSLLGDIDPRIIQMGMSLIHEYRSDIGRSATLLRALRPFVREKRYARIDRAVQAARLSRVIRVLIDAMRKQGGEMDV